MITSRSRAMTLLAVAFVVGVVVGGGALSMAVRAGKANWVWQWGRSNGRPGFGGQREDFATRIAHQLKLSDAQKDSIASIYKRAAADMDSINKASLKESRPMWLKIDSLVQPFRASVDSSRAKMRADVRALLEPPKQQSFDSLMKSIDDARRKWREGQGGPGPSGNGGGRGGPGPGPGSGSMGPGRGGSPGSGQPGGGAFDGPF
jgi:hypothetical protein